MTTLINTIKRHGNHIRCGKGITAVEGYDGLPTLSIRKNGKEINLYRGSSLGFSEELTNEDRDYLKSLIKL